MTQTKPAPSRSPAPTIPAMSSSPTRRTTAWRRDRSRSLRSAGAFDTTQGHRISGGLFHMPMAVSPMFSPVLQPCPQASSELGPTEGEAKRASDQNVAVCRTNYMLGNAAKQKMRESGTSVRTENDEIGAAGLDLPEDDSSGIAKPDDRVPLRPCQRIHDLMQP
jgi:hypothetical protein